MKIAVLIPAYNPDSKLFGLVNNLSSKVFSAIVVVNDGSVDACDPIFCELENIEKVTVLRHAVNLGKGAALKTGLNHIYCRFRCCNGIILMDADGQHLVEDALKVADQLATNPHSLIIGVRDFCRDVPFRSKIGNRTTGYLFHLLTGTYLKDTQSGLRGVPREFIPDLLRINSNGYEFELDMLMACKYTGTDIVEQSIQTVYLENNKSSHFNPIVDSMKIYFVLFRFTLTSLVSALIDNSVFIVIFGVSSSIAISQLSARIVATTFNYSAVRKIVFFSDKSPLSTLPKYLSLVAISGLVSFFLIKIMLSYLPFSVIGAKICAESLIFLANFSIQRDFIFVNSKHFVNRGIKCL